MANTSELKTYELSFHIDPDLEELDAMNGFQELSEFISKNGGIIGGGSKNPRRIRLSYPVRKKQAAYFGTLNLSAAPEVIEKITAQLKLRNDIIRYLLLLAPDNKNLRVLGERRYRPRIKTQEEKLGTVVKPKEKAAESGERLEQEIEKAITSLPEHS